MTGKSAPSLSTCTGSKLNSSDTLSIRHFLPLAGFALLFRLVLAPWICYSGDLYTFISWAKRLADLGPAEFWSDGYWCDYLPGYLLILWPLGLLSNLLSLAHINIDVLLFKLPNIFADLGSAYLIWRLLGPTEQNKKLWVPIIYLFNPAILINSTIWGQADSLHTFCMLAALYLLVYRRTEWSALAFGFSAAFKPHTIVLLPLAAVYAFRAQTKWYRIAGALLIVCAIFLATFLPFHDGQDNALHSFIKDRIKTTMGQYGYASVNALNLWYLAGQNFGSDQTAITDTLNIHQAGTMLFSLCYAVAICWFWGRYDRHKNQALFESAAIILLATFCFVTRAHERHLFAFFAMTAIIIARAPGTLIPYGILSITYTANMIFSWFWLLKPTFSPAQICSPLLAGIICVVNLACLPLSMMMFTGTGDRLIDKIRLSENKTGRKRLPKLAPDSAWIQKNGRYLLCLIILFALGTRLYRLHVPPERIHDEIYHAYTAEQWVEGNTDAWLWNTKVPDKGCAYEWTHPPLAKLFMAASMKIFGIHSWAWRLPAALLGTLSILLIYGIAITLFEQKSIALLAAALGSLDALPIVMSRIGMNDIYCSTFILVSVWAALRYRHYLSALCLGAALACKWSAIYAAPLLALIYLIRPHPRHRYNFAYLAELTAVYATALVGVYLAGYIPFFYAGHTIGDFQELHRQMWFYHTGLTATHPGASPAWAWPISRGFMWFYTSQTADPKANIYALGNLIIWFAGLLAILYSAYYVYMQRERDRKMPVILAGYLVFWAPWLLSPRIMFINHYLPSLPFLYIALAAGLKYLKISRANIICLFVFAGICLAVMFPYITAIPLPAYLAPLEIKQFFISLWTPE